MKKVLLASAALMLTGGVFAPAFAADVTPGVTFTADARTRFYYRSEAYAPISSTVGNASFGNYLALPGTAVNSAANPVVKNANEQSNFDSRIRLNFTGTTAGGAYVKGRIRMMENTMGDMGNDVNEINSLTQNNIWADQAYMGVPFTPDLTVEFGKYRSTYGPLGATNNFFYDDVNLTGAKGIIKVGKDIVVNPFIEYVREGQNVTATGNSSNSNVNGGSDQRMDHDSIRFGGHVKAKVNPDWTVGGMLGYQTDSRDEAAKTTLTPASTAGQTTGTISNDGMFGSVYAIGKSGAFGVNGELAFTSAHLNGFNNWNEDYNIVANSDSIGSKDTGFGGYVFPNFTMDKLNLGLNLGFTQNGFMPDRAFGFVMLGATDNSVITAQKIGDYGDWLWIGLVPSYKINESLKLTGNLVYAKIDAWTENGDGPGFTAGPNRIAMEHAWELSAMLQYTISKGANLFFAAGYLDPSIKIVNQTNPALTVKDDAVLGAYTRLEIAF